MPRRAGVAPGGQIYHVLNRASGDLVLFETAACYRRFLHLVAESADAFSMRILAYCAMPNHWHMLLWPREDEEMRRFVQRLTIRHSHHWHVRKGSVGRGPLYQGRYKSFLVADDAYLLTVCRYIELNPVRARLVERAEHWAWSSARSRSAGLGEPPIRSANDEVVMLEPFPMELPVDWLRWINESQTEAELYRIRRHLRSGAPFGQRSFFPIEDGTPGDPKCNSRSVCAPKEFAAGAARELRGRNAE